MAGRQIGFHCQAFDVANTQPSKLGVGPFPLRTSNLNAQRRALRSLLRTNALVLCVRNVSTASSNQFSRIICGSTSFTAQSPTNRARRRVVRSQAGLCGGASALQDLFALRRIRAWVVKRYSTQARLNIPPVTIR
jgi:hypothetical protein